MTYPLQATGDLAAAILAATGIPVGPGIGGVTGQNTATRTFHRLPDATVCDVVWTQTPTAGQITQADNIIRGFVPTSPRTLPQLRAALHALTGATAKLLPAATTWATAQDDTSLHTLAADSQANTTKAEILVARWLQMNPNGAIALGISIRGVQ